MTSTTTHDTTPDEAPDTAQPQPEPPISGDACVDPRVARSRSAVLAAATELLVEAGPRAVTVDAVVERSGVAKSTLYRHWESRTALLVDVMACSVPDVPLPSRELGFEASLRALVRNVAATLGTPEWAALMPALISLKQHMPELQELSDADHEHKIGALNAVLDLGVAEGALPSGLDAARVSTVLIGPVVFTLLTGRLDEVADVADFAVDRFLASYRR